MGNNFTTLDKVLAINDSDLAKLKKGEFETEKLGLLPYTAIDHNEYKKAKRECIKMIPDGTGGMEADIDDDKLMVKLIIEAVDKDDRSDFSFANKQLLAKLNKAFPDKDIVTAEQAVAALLSPGEIYNMAIEIQNLSGFGKKAQKKIEEEVKNY